LLSSADHALTRAPQGAAGQAHCTVCANVTPAASPRAPEMRAPQGAPCFARACVRRRAACSRASNREPRKEPARARARERRRRLRERATANEHVRTSWSKAPTRSARSSRAQAIGEVDTPSPCTGSRASRDARPRSRRRRRGGTIDASEPTPQGGGAQAKIDAASEQLREARAPQGARRSREPASWSERAKARIRQTGRSTNVRLSAGTARCPPERTQVCRPKGPQPGAPHDRRERVRRKAFRERPSRRPIDREVPTAARDPRPRGQRAPGLPQGSPSTRRPSLQQQERKVEARAPAKSSEQNLEEKESEEGSGLGRGE
jgi:hypothetical protein